MAAHCRSCGKSIVNEDGSENYERQFCPPPAECAKNFRRDALRAKRAKTKQRNRCSHCGQTVLPPDIRQEVKKLAAKAGIQI
jgi:DNA-directed RNA polymerase subunit RPC12/RpoP